MSSSGSVLPAGRALVALDAVIALWVVAWVTLGLAIGHQVSGLRALSQTTTKVGSALRQTGATLDTLGSLPLVGRQLGQTARQIEDAGASTVASGHASRDSVHSLSWMLALAIAVIPSIPVIGFYLPVRLLAVRERRRLRAVVAAHGEDPAFRRYLAHRALLTMPYDRLVATEREPWAGYSDGAFEALADSELRRMGIRRRTPR